MHKVISTLGLLLMLTAAAAAQVVPKGNVFFGYSYMDMSPQAPSNVNGWDGSLEGKVAPLLGLVVDLSGHYGSHDTSVYNVLLGPRLSFSFHGVRPFVHGFVGVAHESISGVGSTSFSAAIGGGADVNVVHLLAWRLQLDGVRTDLYSHGQTNFRLSTGPVLRF